MARLEQHSDVLEMCTKAQKWMDGWRRSGGKNHAAFWMERKGESFHPGREDLGFLSCISRMVLMSMSMRQEGRLDCRSRYTLPSKLIHSLQAKSLNPAFY